MHYKLCALETTLGEESGSFHCCSRFQVLACFCQLTHDHRVYFTLNPAFHSCFNLLRHMTDDQIKNRYTCGGEAKLFHLEQLALNDQ